MSLALNDKQDYEIINGQIYMMSRASLNHNRIAFNINKIFDRHFRNGICESHIEPDVFLDDKNNFIPDVAVLCDSSKRKPRGIYGAPDLVVEILSPGTEKIDIADKKDVYGKNGVKEYWTVDPMSKKITVYYLNNNNLELNNIYYYRTSEQIEEMPDDDQKAIVSSFRVNLFDDLVINLEEVFEKIH